MEEAIDVKRLPAELLLAILQTLPVAALAKSRQACRGWRAVADEASAGALAMLGALPELRADELNQTMLCTALGLSPKVAQTLPYVAETRRNGMGYYVTYIFDPVETVDVLVQTERWDGLAARLAAKAAKKRKRDDLDDRRLAACAKRRARLEDWLAREEPIGPGIDSVEAWERDRAGVRDAVASDPTLNKFLSSGALAGPSLAAAKEALVAVHQSLVAREQRVKDMQEALGALGLQWRADSRLCDAYVKGEPIGAFTTAAAVAREMALMRWLHEYTDYAHWLHEEKETLVAIAGYYYRGINADARDRAKARFVDACPATWPWMAA